MNQNLISFEKNRKRRPYLVFIILLLLLPIFCFVGYFTAKDDVEYVEINTVYSEEDASNRYAFTEITFFIASFTSDYTNSEMWLLGDIYGEFHAVKVNATNRELLSDILAYSTSADDSLPIPTAVKLVGKTKLMSDELIGLAHKATAEFFQEEISLDSFNAYMRGIYLDADTQTPSVFYLVLGILLLLLPLVLLINYFKSSKKAKNSINCLQISETNVDVIEVVKEEISLDSTMMFGKYLYLTNRFVVFACGFVSVIELSAIDRIYINNLSVNFISCYILNIHSNGIRYRFKLGLGDNAKAQGESCLSAIALKQAENASINESENYDDPFSSDSF